MNDTGLDMWLTMSVVLAALCTPAGHYQGEGSNTEVENTGEAAKKS